MPINTPFSSTASQAIDMAHNWLPETNYLTSAILDACCLGFWFQYIVIDCDLLWCEFWSRENEQQSWLKDIAALPINHQSSSEKCKWDWFKIIKAPCLLLECWQFFPKRVWRTATLTSRRYKFHKIKLCTMRLISIVLWCSKNSLYHFISAIL